MCRSLPYTRKSWCPLEYAVVKRQLVEQVKRLTSFSLPRLTRLTWFVVDNVLGKDLVLVKDNNVTMYGSPMGVISRLKSLAIVTALEDFAEAHTVDQQNVGGVVVRHISDLREIKASTIDSSFPHSYVIVLVCDLMDIVQFRCSMKREY